MDDNDHRSIANRMGLFHQQEDGPGMVFWHPRGFQIFMIIESYIRKRMRRAGFTEIRTPQLLARSLWEQSGHWEKFGENMFALAEDEQVLALKPMSCPAHVQVFDKGVRSFRDLPIRYCELGGCHRNEPSGALHGLMRTRAFVQDDAHIFCTEDHVEAEVARFCALLQQAYADSGFADARVALSTRPAKRAGDDALWDRAEAKLEAAARSASVDYEIEAGEGAFYGPKLDFFLRDRQQREWQCGTVQLDLVLPERLDAHYTDANGQSVRRVMVHHAVLGSVERFIGMLLEHHQGMLPLWLGPDQIVVASISDAQPSYADEVAAALEGEGFRVVTDKRSECLPKKIVDARRLGIPITLVVGQQEARDRSVSMRRLDGSQQVIGIDAATKLLEAEAVP